MNDLLQTHAFLNQVVQGDVLLCLAQTVCWLDPLWRGHEHDDFYYHDPRDLISEALIITRKCFPDLYVDAIDKLRQGADYETIDTLICEGVSATGIPIDALEHLPFGIPLPAYGVELEDPEFYANYPDVIPILELFGISPLPNPHNIVPAQCVYQAAGMIADDLLLQEDERYQKLAWSISWLFSCSGNSLVDWSFEMMCEVEPLMWTAKDIEFAYVMIQEADDIMSKALDGLVWLTEQPAVVKNLQENIHKIYKAIQKKGNNDDVPNVRLRWHNPTIYTERAA